MSIFGATIWLNTHSEEFQCHHCITVDEFTSAKLGLINLLGQLCSLKENWLCFAYLYHALVLDFIFLFCNFCCHLFAYLWLLLFIFNPFFFYSFDILSPVLNNIYLISCKILKFLSFPPKTNPFFHLLCCCFGEHLFCNCHCETYYGFAFLTNFIWNESCI